MKIVDPPLVALILQLGGQLDLLTGFIYLYFLNNTTLIDVTCD